MPGGTGATDGGGRFGDSRVRDSLSMGDILAGDRGDPPCGGRLIWAMGHSERPGACACRTASV